MSYNLCIIPFDENWCVLALGKECTRVFFCFFFYFLQNFTRDHCAQSLWILLETFRAQENLVRNDSDANTRDFFRQWLEKIFIFFHKKLNTHKFWPWKKMLWLYPKGNGQKFICQRVKITKVLGPEYSQN